MGDLVCLTDHPPTCFVNREHCHGANFSILASLGNAASILPSPLLFGETKLLMCSSLHDGKTFHSKILFSFISAHHVLFFLVLVLTCRIHPFRFTTFTHNRISHTLWSVGMHEAGCVASLSGEANWISWDDAPPIRGGGRSHACHQLAQERPQQRQSVHCWSRSLCHRQPRHSRHVS